MNGLLSAPTIDFHKLERPLMMSDQEGVMRNREAMRQFIEGEIRYMDQRMPFQFILEDLDLV
jgi:hypothetical protein